VKSIPNFRDPCGRHAFFKDICRVNHTHHKHTNKEQEDLKNSSKVNMSKISGIKCIISITILTLLLSVRATDNVWGRVKTQSTAVASITIRPADSTYKCDGKSHPLEIINHSSSMTITATLELTYKDVTNRRISEKEIVFDKLLPGETRYIGCAGCTVTQDLEKCTEYRVLDAYYEQPDSVRVRELLR